MNDLSTTAQAMDKAADEAAEVLKVLANPSRLRILCALLPGERCVGELEEILGASQSYVSGQLARMRSEGLVSCDRDGRTIRYKLADPRISPILERLYDVFCPEHVKLDLSQSVNA
ncbi:winged helix-turn-helix transcriptional regulator [Marivivens donghaensis]|uniref:Winged helix-turn-helix transcriptional regulator n=2 Tax=Marivivens donghaensis TaxID=1699413 RepID=A0ABX0W393_9RHOB|nr:metalloregulator ArsR/SmtB family transcription factor [Marivivens aquimaris]NIY73862.1 winged helix-turn-helix transcriptional regulator [Marivivens donghaensis]